MERTDTSRSCPSDQLIIRAPEGIRLGPVVRSGAASPCVESCGPGRVLLGLSDHPKSQVRRGRGNQHLGAFEGDRRVEPQTGGCRHPAGPDHVHADLIDQAERECLLQDGRAMQTDNLVALRALGLLNRADDAVGDDV
jgi:hypothetical protein